jgi:hypothetical protein
MSHEDDAGRPPPVEPADDAKTARRRVLRRNFAERFRLQQARVREWICFQEIAVAFAEFYARGSVPNEEERTRNYDRLVRDLLDGDFEEHGRSMVRYLNSWSERSHMTREWLGNVIEEYAKEQEAWLKIWGDSGRLPPNTVRSRFLDHCWIPRRMYDRWRVKHSLPTLPRFTPTEPDRRPITDPVVQPAPVRPVVQAEPVPPDAQPEEVQDPSKAAPSTTAGKRAGRRGPKPGRVDRYGADDRALFPTIIEMISTGGSVRAAALQLAEQGKITGHGSKESRAKRLERKFLRHRSHEEKAATEARKLDPTKSH